MKEQLQISENEYSVTRKQLNDAQSLNYEFKKQIETLQADSEQQLSTIEQYQVLIIHLFLLHFKNNSFRLNVII